MQIGVLADIFYVLIKVGVDNNYFYVCSSVRCRFRASFECLYEYEVELDSGNKQTSVVLPTLSFGLNSCTFSVAVRRDISDVYRVFQQGIPPPKLTISIKFFFVIRFETLLITCYNLDCLFLNPWWKIHFSKVKIFRKNGYLLIVQVDSKLKRKFIKLNYSN